MAFGLKFFVCSGRTDSIRDNLELHWTILYSLRCQTLLLTMNRLKRLAAVLLNPAEDPEQMHAALEAAGVPVSFADCRNCPNPCEDGKTLFPFPWTRLLGFTGHEEYPKRITSMIDTTSDMLGSVKPYRRQVRVQHCVT